MQICDARCAALSQRHEHAGLVSLCSETTTTLCCSAALRSEHRSTCRISSVYVQVLSQARLGADDSCVSTGETCT